MLVAYINSVHYYSVNCKSNNSSKVHMVHQRVSLVQQNLLLYLPMKKSSICIYIYIYIEIMSKRTGHAGEIAKKYQMRFIICWRTYKEIIMESHCYNST